MPCCCQRRRLQMLQLLPPCALNNTHTHTHTCTHLMEQDKEAEVGGDTGKKGQERKNPGSGVIERKMGRQNHLLFQGNDVKYIYCTVICHCVLKRGADGNKVGWFGSSRKGTGDLMQRVHSLIHLLQWDFYCESLLAPVFEPQRIL